KEVPTLPLDVSFNLYEDTDDDSMQIKQLYNRINKLGFIDRSIILMWLENMSYEEIGAILGITANNVSVKLVRIREKLKQM
ncbi:MAG: sigma-70 family RNA polymerase sigma factor, partial [Bacteroidales bacterium]|nr:sigma-70 family RNA polymerase sigma factor [Bacteroidales bacterium]